MSVQKMTKAELIDQVEWLEKGNDEWRTLALSKDKQAKACQATARIAIDHLQKLLNERRTAQQSWEAEQAAREWLTSIG